MTPPIVLAPPTPCVPWDQGTARFSSEGGFCLLGTAIALRPSFGEPPRLRITPVGYGLLAVRRTCGGSVRFGSVRFGFSTTPPRHCSPTP